MDITEKSSCFLHYLPLDQVITYAEFFLLLYLAATLLFNNQSVNIHGELKREAETTKSFLSENNSLVHLTSEK